MTDILCPECGEKIHRLVYEEKRPDFEKDKITRIIGSTRYGVCLKCDKVYEIMIRSVPTGKIIIENTYPREKMHPFQPEEETQ